MEIQNITQWCDVMDRGGLYHTTEEFIATLIKIETMTKHQIREVCLNGQSISNMKNSITTNKTVCELWDKCTEANLVSASRRK